MAESVNCSTFLAQCAALVIKHNFILGLTKYCLGLVAPANMKRFFFWFENK